MVLESQPPPASLFQSPVSCLQTRLSLQPTQVSVYCLKLFEEALPKVFYGPSQIFRKSAGSKRRNNNYLRCDAASEQSQSSPHLFFKRIWSTLARATRHPKSKRCKLRGRPHASTARAAEHWWPRATPRLCLLFVTFLAPLPHPSAFHKSANSSPEPSHCVAALRGTIATRQCFDVLTAPSTHKASL